MPLSMRMAAAAALVTVAGPLASCEGGIDLDSGIDGSGTIASATYEPTGFQTLAFGSEGDVRVVIGEISRVVVTTDDNLLEYLEVRSDGNTLFLETADGVNIDPTSGVEWVVTTPSLAAVTLSGAGDIDLPPLSGALFEARLDGAGDIRIADLDTSALDVDLMGAGDVIAAGSADELTVTIGGAGDFAGLDLVTTRADVTVSGAGSAEVHVTGTLEALVSGAGSVKYTGGAEVTSSVTGAGSIEPVG